MDLPQAFSSLSLSPASECENNACQENLHQLRHQVAQLEAELTKVRAQIDAERVMFEQSFIYSSAKNKANAVLHSLFDICSAGKHDALKTWISTGVLPTRGSLNHVKTDPRLLRDDKGRSLCHVVTTTSIAREPKKYKTLELLLDVLEFDPNIRDPFGRSPLHYAALAGYATLVELLLQKGADKALQDKAGVTALALVQTLSRPRVKVVELLLQNPIVPAPGPSEPPIVNVVQHGNPIQLATMTRQKWYYIVLSKPVTYRIPGVLNVQIGSPFVEYIPPTAGTHPPHPTIPLAQSLMNYLPTKELVVIDSQAYLIVDYNAKTNELELDRPYEGATTANARGFLTGSCRFHDAPLKLSVQGIVENDPGNRFDNEQSKEIQLFQLQQCLDPADPIEYGAKLGPLQTWDAATRLCKVWRRQVQASFKARECRSKGLACETYCPQKQGQALCLESIVEIGKQIAKEELGKMSYLKKIEAHAIAIS